MNPITFHERTLILNMRETLRKTRSAAKSSCFTCGGCFGDRTVKSDKEENEEVPGYSMGGLLDKDHLVVGKTMKGE